MKKIYVIVILVCLSTASCKTKPAQVGIAYTPQDNAKARMLAHEELERYLSTPMTQDRYAGYVERMGRVSERFDYLYEAALAQCYADLQKNEKHKAIVLAKSKQYFQIWTTRSKQHDIHCRGSHLSTWMIAIYQEILTYDSDHPLRLDILSAIQELKEYQKTHNKTIDGD